MHTSASSLRQALDRLANQIFNDDPVHELVAAGLSEVRAYVITVAGEPYHYITAVAPNGQILDATAWSAPAAAALLMADLDTQVFAAAA